MRLVIFIMVLVLAQSCNKQREVRVYNDAGHLEEKYYIDKDSVRNGPYESYYDNGQLQEKAFYRNGLLDGERVLYFENGQSEIVEHYLEGRMHGPYEVYYASGAPLLKQVFDRDTLRGESLRFYENGQLEEKVFFVDNLENGPFQEFHENGQLHWEGQYLNGDNEFGLLKEYDESGTLIKKMACDSLAVCRTIWTIEEGDISPKY